MSLRQVGSSGVQLSAVGFGTCQLRLVPEEQALATLRRGFELGVNWVHTAPDYGGAERYVAKAVREARAQLGAEVHVLSNASGPVEHFGWAFENTCKLLGTERLSMFGISGIDYCEEIGQNVFGAGGMLEWLERRREEGRLDGIFCTTHGSPDFVERLITSGRFDAIMLAYNPLGFHVLSYHGADEGKDFEVITENRERIFPLAEQHGVSLLVMKPLAGGMLVSSKAFPAHERYSSEAEPLRAREVLRTILTMPEVCAVVPGTASVEEAEENGRAGHDLPEPTRAPASAPEFDDTIRDMQASLCSRCGECHESCSRQLPVSWLFREAYIWSYPSDTFEALGRLHYLKLHPERELQCSSCDDQSCVCPSGLDIPAGLQRAHERVLDLHARGLMHCTDDELAQRVVRGHVSAAVVWAQIPEELHARALGVCRLWIHNAGADEWLTHRTRPGGATQALVVFLNGKPIVTRALMEDVGPEQRALFSFNLQAPKRLGRHQLAVALVALHPNGKLGERTVLMERELEVAACLANAPMHSWLRDGLERVSRGVRRFTGRGAPPG